MFHFIYLFRLHVCARCSCIRYGNNQCFCFLFVKYVLGHIMCTRLHVQMVLMISLVTTAVIWKDGYCGYMDEFSVTNRVQSYITYFE